MEIGFVGVGRMGSRMAANLIGGGHRLWVCDTAPEALERAARMGATVCSSPKEASEGREVVLLSLMHSHTVEEVVLGENGVLSASSVPPLLVDTSTVLPGVTKRVAAAALEKGCQMLDAPVSTPKSDGSEAAEAGRLTIMVGGPRDAFERVLPLLKLLGKEIFRVGEVGTGNTMKVINNLLQVVSKAAIAEALMLGTLAGIDPKTIYQVGTASTGNSWSFQKMVPRVLRGDFEPGGTVVSNHKVLSIASQLGEELGLPMPVVNSAREVFQVAMASGLANNDGSAVILPLEQLMGVEVRVQSTE